jgi:anti-sigma B factor antagonist
MICVVTELSGLIVALTPLIDQAQEVDMSATWQESTIQPVQVAGSITVVELTGEFDVSNARHVIDHAQRVLDTGRGLIVDLSEATFIDSAIVHALFAVNEAAGSKGRQFVLQVGSQPAVERILSITKLDRSLACAPSRDEAIALINRRSSRTPD